MLKQLASLVLMIAPAVHAAEPVTVKVEPQGLRSNKGTVRCAVYRSKKGFPDNPERAVASTAAKVTNQRATCTFQALPPGKYGISFIHDEDDDGELDTNFLGIPREGYGFSNDAEGSMGPPDFEKTIVSIEASKTIRLTTRY